MKKRIEAINEYLKYFPNDIKANENLLLCKYADELNLELSNSAYPRMDGYRCKIAPHIYACKRIHLINSATQYKQDGKNTIIVCVFPFGRLSFVDSKYYDDIDDEWNDFIKVLKSYNPIDYDILRDEYLYNVEDGKRLINDFENIVQDFQQKVNKKIKEVDIANKKKRIEELQKELMEINQNE